MIFAGRKAVSVSMGHATTAVHTVHASRAESKDDPTKGFRRT